MRGIIRQKSDFRSTDYEQFEVEHQEYKNLSADGETQNIPRTTVCMNVGCVHIIGAIIKCVVALTVYSSWGLVQLEVGP
jgi:hypothetical protein